MLLHDQYTDFDTEYRSQIFRAREKLLGSVESDTLLPDNELSARNLLDDDQLNVVKGIRKRRLEPVLSRFIPD